MTDQQQNLVKICGLWEKESGRGNRYFLGVCGSVKYLIFRDREQARANPPRSIETPKTTWATSRCYGAISLHLG